QVTHDADFLDFWPSELNMPPSWVVWAIFAAARFRLLEVSVPLGTATLEKLAALAPGGADRRVQRALGGAGGLSHRLQRDHPWAPHRRDGPTGRRGRTRSGGAGNGGLATDRNEARTGFPSVRTSQPPCARRLWHTSCSEGG